MKRDRKADWKALERLSAKSPKKSGARLLFHDPVPQPARRIPTPNVDFATIEQQIMDRFQQQMQNTYTYNYAANDTSTGRSSGTWDISNS